MTFREKMIPTEEGSYVTIQFTTLRFIFAWGKVKIKEMMSLILHRLIKHKAITMALIWNLGFKISILLSNSFILI